jgi:tryptophan synthase alpha chain
MSRLKDYFAGFEEQGRTVLAPYFMAGYPDLDTSFRLIKTAVSCGANLIELGMPFSDPLADGPTIQKAGVKALENPFTLEQLISRFAQERADIDIPVVLMTYYNPILQLGIENTARLAAEAGLEGFIVPDLPIEEADPFDQACRATGVDLVHLVAPTSSEERIREIDSKTSGMLYYVSRLGITGARSDLPAGLLDSLDRYRSLITHPSVVGFGISKPEHASSLRGHVDGVVIASAIIQCLEAAAPEHYEEVVRKFLEPISQVLNSAVETAS